MTTPSAGINPASAPHRPIALALVMAALVGLPTYALDNGVGRTPAMGVNPYNYLMAYNDQMWRMTADAVVASGMKDAGYQYVNTDCGLWYYDGSDKSSAGSRVTRFADGTLRVDTLLLPQGLKPVADYVHSKGLKLGTYHMPAMMGEFAGTGNIERDAKSLAGWGVDYVKWDGWSGSTEADFTAMRDALKSAGRPIYLSINGSQGGTLANQWRTGSDIDPTWESIMSEVGAYAGDSKPGAWNDPDMMNIGLMDDEEQEKAHMSLWCVVSAPLLHGNDVRQMFLSTQYIILNTEAIAVDQDTAFAANPAYGGSGKKVKEDGAFQIWLKTVTGGAKVVVMVNTGTAAGTGTVAWSDIGLPAGTAQVRDLWEHQNLGPFTDKYSATVPGHACKFLKIVSGATPIPEPKATWFPKPADAVALNPLPKAGWTATSNFGTASQYIDGDIKTPLQVNSPNDVNWIVIDMKAPKTFNCVVLNNGLSGVGTVLKPYHVFTSNNNLRLYVSKDGTSWGQPVFTGFMGPRFYAAMTFPSQTAQYLKIVDSLSATAQRTGWVNDIGFRRPFHGEDGEEVSEIYVAQSDAAAVGMMARARGARPSAARRWVATGQASGAYFRPQGRTDAYRANGRSLARPQSFKNQTSP